MKYSKEETQSLFEQSKYFLHNPPESDLIEELREVIRFHEWKYYVKNDPILSDFEYDQLYSKLKELEIDYPELINPESPTQRVSVDLTEEFNTVQHLEPMLSLDNSYNKEDLVNFDKQVRKLCKIDENTEITYSVEPKFDGGSIAIIYQNDLLVRAATRGNGFEGEEMTNNARAMPSLPLKAAFSKYGMSRVELRGEAVIRKDNFKKINQKRSEIGKILFANPRNTAAGGLRTKDPSETRNREIETFIFQLSYAENKNGENALDQFQSHFALLDLLSDLGFKIPATEKKLCPDIHSVLEFVQSWESKREDFPYEIDGMVVKVDRRDIQKMCGSTSHHPRWAVAYKFKAKQTTTKLVDIVYQVGKVGSITPVAKLEPVQLAGVTVSSVSLHNEDFIKSKDLRIGDMVLVERAGDVIPYIVKSFAELRSGSEIKIQFPKDCPINDQDIPVPLEKDQDEAAWRCPECICGAQDLQKIIFHISKSAMDIDGFGKAYVERFYELGWIKDISDVYNLDYNKIAELEGFGTKSAQNLENAVNKAKNNPIHRLLHSLSIHHLGQKASKLIAEKINHVLDLAGWELEDFTQIKDIGPVVAENVMQHFQSQENIEILKKMEAYGVNLFQTEDDKPVVVNEQGSLYGKTVLFTGTLNKMTRKEAQKLAETAGASNISAVSKNLDILVVGEKAGSKLKKAQDIGTIQILSEEDFLELVNEL